jgi:hypothetical protein
MNKKVADRQRIDGDSVMLDGDGYDGYSGTF